MSAVFVKDNLMMLDQLECINKLFITKLVHTSAVIVIILLLVEVPYEFI